MLDREPSQPPRKAANTSTRPTRECRLTIRSVSSPESDIRALHPVVVRTDFNHSAR